MLASTRTTAAAAAGLITPHPSALSLASTASCLTPARSVATAAIAAAAAGPSSFRYITIATSPLSHARPPWKGTTYRRPGNAQGSTAALAVRSLHTSTPRLFDAQSLSASADDEGAPASAILTAAKQPTEPADEGVWRGGGEPTIVLTRRAVERLQSIAAAEGKSSSGGGATKLALRLAVEPGGCHGYQYKIELTDEAEEDDFHFHAPPPRSQSASPEQHAQPLPILIDSTSLALLKGSTIDYVTELIGSQFAIRENPQAKGSGCGCGISWEPAI